MLDAIHNTATMQKANAIFTKYRRFCLLVGWGIPIVFLFLYFNNRRVDIYLAGLVIWLLVGRLIIRKMNRKMIYGELLDNQNAPLFYHVVHQGKQYNEAGIIQIQAELFVGNYANVIPACRKKLADGKCFKKYKYAYLTFLAHSYFALGNDARLKEICDWYDQCMAAEKKKVKKPNGLTMFDFYRAYLNRDLDTCERFLSQKATCPAMQTERDFERARLLLLKGETQAGRELFAQIADSAPMISFGVLAKQAVKTIDAGECYSAPYENFTENVDFALAPPTKAQRRRRVISVACIVIAAATLLHMIVTAVLPGFQEYDTRKELQKALAWDYGEVEIIEMFYLEKGDEVLDAMFIAKTNNSILVGAMYWYEDDDTLYYDVQAAKTISSFDIRPYETFHFVCVTTDYTGYGFFCNDVSYITQNVYHTKSFELDGKTYYLVIDEVSALEWYQTS